jgi:hydroxymethylglutaryl-CoA lyase
MCDESAIKTGVDVTKVMAVSRHLRELLGRDMESYVLRAGRSCDLLAKNEG